MHVGKQFSFFAYLQWTKREILTLAILALIPTTLHVVFNLTFIALPLFIATILGTTVAFVIAFKNNAAAARLYEAQKMYVDIQTTSNYLGMQVKALLSAKTQAQLINLVPIFINQHVAWLTTLRYLLREDKPWENLTEAGNREFSHYYRISEHELSLKEALQPYLSHDQIETLLPKHNPANYCLQLQMDLLQVPRDEGLIERKEFQNILNALNALNASQNNCLRIKNAPYPRNFYSITKYLLYMFLVIFPYCLVGEFDKIGHTWLTIPMSMFIGWVFICLEKVGQNTTNPFEGGLNDVPITHISKSIEIDMRELFGQKEIPEDIKPVNDILS